MKELGRLLPDRTVAALLLVPHSFRRYLCSHPESGGNIAAMRIVRTVSLSRKGLTMARITGITCNHVKGINHLDVPCDFYPNKPNFLVAPNGSDKFPFATNRIS